LGKNHGRFGTAGNPTGGCSRKAVRAPILCAGLLTVVYALNFLDRTIFNVLIERSKGICLKRYHHGPARRLGFVLFYSLLGIPIARVADRLNRRNIVAVALRSGAR